MMRRMKIITKNYTRNKNWCIVKRFRQKSIQRVNFTVDKFVYKTKQKRDIFKLINSDIA